MKKCVKNCADCTEQKKASNGRICHDYWVAKYETMYKAQATANGKNGALQAKVNIAKANENATMKILREVQARVRRYGERNANLKNGIGSAIATIQTSGRFMKKETLQQVWQLLKDAQEADK